MRGKRSLGLALVAATPAAAPAFAQQTVAVPSANAPAKTMTAPGAAAAPSATRATNTNRPSGSLQKYKGDSVGTIDDLLIDDSGKITQTVISTGGVLGMGGKLVAVSFNESKFEGERRQ
jgi:hypothetical protein